MFSKRPISKEIWNKENKEQLEHEDVSKCALKSHLLLNSAQRENVRPILREIEEDEENSFCKQDGMLTSIDATVFLYDLCQTTNRKKDPDLNRFQKKWTLARHWLLKSDKTFN